MSTAGAGKALTAVTRNRKYMAAMWGCGIAVDIGKLKSH